MAVLEPQEVAVISIMDEHKRAIGKFPPFHSAHEGLSIIREEYKELEAEVFKHHSKRELANLEKEAVHLGAMALRFLVDICLKRNNL